MSSFPERHSERANSVCVRPPVECVGVCTLAACTIGRQAMVVKVRCPAADACRLRALGVFEGARVVVLDSRSGMLLDVRGSRLALDAQVAASITVLPLGAA